MKTLVLKLRKITGKVTQLNAVLYTSCRQTNILQIKEVKMMIANDLDFKIYNEQYISKL